MPHFKVVTEKTDTDQSPLTICSSYRVRCDRQLPCKSCLGRGIGSTCSYRSRVPRNKSEVSVGDRIQQLESLVRPLVHQQQQSPQQQYSPQAQTTYSDGPAIDLANSFQGTPGASLQGVPTKAPLASVDEDHIVPGMRHASLSHIRDYAVSTTPSEHGSMRLHSHDHYEEEEARLLAANDHVLHESPGPRLLYEPVQTTKADLLAAIPAQPAVDRMVARYFNAQGVVSEILHSGHFLREYEKSWQEPNAASIAWIGLLFSVMSLSTRYKQSIEGSEDPETPVRVHMFRENVIHCLVLCQWARGGDYMLETLINYLTSELFLSKDSEIGLWLV
ncbi:unnamed protein product [Penicillium viridicatum]